MKIGIVGAMSQEIALLQKEMRDSHQQTRGMRDYHQGTLYGKEAILVFSRWAKVAAASTVTTLIEAFGVDLVVFTGVAGATNSDLEIGDVVIGSLLVQHDLDPRPLFKRFEVPLLNKVEFSVDPRLVDLARKSAQQYIVRDLPHDVSRKSLAEFGIKDPKVYDGLIISGDQFVANVEVVNNLKKALREAGLPEPQCVEMEGAAVAQVCHEYNVPLLVVRAISDKADHSAVIDFVPFVDKVASHFTCGIVKEFIAQV